MRAADASEILGDLMSEQRVRLPGGRPVRVGGLGAQQPRPALVQEALLVEAAPNVVHVHARFFALPRLFCLQASLGCCSALCSGLSMNLPHGISESCMFSEI